MFAERAATVGRHDAGKRGREWQMPMPKSLADELREFQRQLGTVGGWCSLANTS